MASVEVSLRGPSQAAVQARLEQIAREAEVDLHPLHATASFTAGSPTSTYEMTTALHAAALDEDQLRARLTSFVDEAADPAVAVRFVLLP
jgi:hypothetical protein